MRKILLLSAMILASCAAPLYYVFDKDQAHARLKPKVVPIDRTESWKAHDQIADAFPKSLNIPHHKDLAGRVLRPP